MIITSFALLSLCIASFATNVPIFDPDGPGACHIYQMTLYSQNSGSSSSSSSFGDFGHAFVSFSNSHDFSFQMGKFVIPPQTTVFLGKWAGTVCNTEYTPHAGVEYDLEPYLNGGNSLGTSSEIIRAVTISVNSASATEASTFASNQNDGYDVLTNNCVTFATGFFDCCYGSSSIFSGYNLPSQLYEKLGQLSYCQYLSLSDLPSAVFWFFFDGNNVCHTVR